MKTYTLTIGWLYPDLMSTYGDYGNIITLKKRCQWRNITTNVIGIDSSISSEKLSSIDLIFGGGAQDKQQELVIRDLKGRKAQLIKEMIDKDTPALFVCGAPQLMGNYYEPSEGKKIEGLGIFDMVTVHPGKNENRLIGNAIAEVQWQNFSNGLNEKTIIVGFENHGGRTTLGKTAKPFAHIIKGYGNNGIDLTEGIIYKNAIGCYFHGPLLPKNPIIADWLIKTSLEIKYNSTIQLPVLNDVLENQAHKTIVSTLTRGI